MNKKKSKGKKTFITLVVLLSITFFFFLLIFLLRIRPRRRHYTYEYSVMMRTLEREDYEEVAQMVYDNEAHGNVPKEDCSEFIAFSRYYNAATLYQAFLGSGDTEQAEKQKRIMETERTKLLSQEFIDAADHYLMSIQQ